MSLKTKNLLPSFVEAKINLQSSLDVDVGVDKVDGGTKLAWILTELRYKMNVIVNINVNLVILTDSI